MNSLFLCYNENGGSMKKYKIYLIFIVILMIIPVFCKLLKKNHEVVYKIRNYQIEEKFQIENKSHTYEFYITKGKEEYSFTMENKNHKKTKIINEIKVYKEEDVKCILPIYNNKKELDLYCRKGNIQVSKEILKEDKNYKEILKKVEKYNLRKDSEKENIKNYKNMKVYNSNIEDNALIIWNYKGIYILKNDENKYQKFLDYDLYDNIEATTTSKYFVLLENTSVNGIEKIHCYDLVKEKYKVITLEEKLSKNSYINGVENDLVYITDTKKKKQYTLNIKKEELKEVGNEEDNYIKYIDQEKIYLKKSDFFEKKQFFKNEKITEEKITKSEDLIKENNIYYYKEDNSFYRQYENRNKVLLFEMENVEEWNVVNGKILFRIGDKLYLMEEGKKLKQLLEYNELKYNYQNIYYLWK